MKLYGLKSCDTCRKAIRDLRENGIEVDVVDVRADGVPPVELARFHATFGEDLINRRSTTWRNLSPSERTGDPLSLLAAHPTLMKRPIIEAHNNLHIGWSTVVRAALLG
jgi:arsenate reductase